MNRRGKRLLEDLHEEIREHIELATQENIERGMAPEEAHYAAVQKFGNITRVPRWAPIAPGWCANF